MKYCFVIPNYNHVTTIGDVIEQLKQFNLPIFLIDDASDGQAAEAFERLADAEPSVCLVRHEVNQGKGGAVQTGLRLAYEQGYDYAIQVDADGQHDLGDIEQLITLSTRFPDSVISGSPVYDSSVPKHRYWARYITHFWVAVETLSLNVKDTMCGFRVYPLQPCMTLLNRCKLGTRMEFDIEIMVRLYWQGVDCHFLPTKVVYPEHGISHFRAFEDNVRISWMHTRLFFGMLWRSPGLLKRSVLR